jgi:hypothetical protein
MQYDSRQLTLLISSASHHLHTLAGNVATALLDTQGSGRVLFSNSALSQVDGTALLSLARDYAERTLSGQLGFYKHSLAEDPELVLYFTVIDERHVFIVVGHEQDEWHVTEFNERLNRLLPEVMG